MHLHFFFFAPPLPATLPPNHHPPTHTHPRLATATPPGRVKIDSLASSTRQLRAICSHLGCSSSFCFCDCSSNIIGLKVLERRTGEGEWRRGPGGGGGGGSERGGHKNEEWHEEELIESNSRTGSSPLKGDSPTRTRTITIFIA